MRRALDGNPSITNPFGQAGYGYFGRHAGYDYGVVNQPVKAPESGVITAVYTGRENVDGGNIVELRSGKYDHRFLHLKSPSVKVGQTVAEGQVIGTSGNTGNVGYHLHHDVRTKGTGWRDAYANYVDWEKLIKQGANMPTLTTKADLDVIYRDVLERARGTGEGENVYLNKDYRWVHQDVRNSKEAGIVRASQASKDKTIKDLQTALTNEKNKPPKEVIKTVEKIVEKVVEVEKPVEVIKEVEPSWIIKLREWINSFLKKGN